MSQRIAVAVQRVDGRILVRRRPKSAATYPESWETPGGKVLEGETWAQAVEREFAEETGLDPWNFAVGGIVGAWRRDGMQVVAFEVVGSVAPGFVPWEPGMLPVVPSLGWLVEEETASTLLRPPEMSMLAGPAGDWAASLADRRQLLLLGSQQGRGLEGLSPGATVPPPPPSTGVVC